MQTIREKPRPIRVAVVFGGSVVRERVYDAPCDVNVDVLDAPLLTAGEHGWELSLSRTMQGAIWIDGRRHSVSELGERVALGSKDYGVVTIGRTALFFQPIAPVRSTPTSTPFDGNAIASMALSTFLHAAALIFLFLAQREAPRPVGLELSPAFLRFLVTPPPELVESGGEAAPSEREEVAAAEAGEAAPEVGDRAARSPERGSDDDAPSVGLLGAIRGGPGQHSALDAALRGPSIEGLLSSLRAGGVRRGHGRGYGLAGVGPGELGDALHGPGEIDTRVGEGERRRRGAPERRPPAEHRIGLPPPPPTRGPGYLPPGAIQRVVERNRNAIAFCYELSLQRSPDLRGRVGIEWVIGLDGRVDRARVEQSTLHDARVEGCMVRQVRGWRFPEPQGGVVEVHYPFLLGT